MTDSYRYVGKATPREDAVSIVTGDSQFVDDLKFDNLLYAKVLRSPHPHAYIRKIDTSKAATAEGVRSILTWGESPRLAQRKSPYPAPRPTPSVRRGCGRRGRGREHKAG